MDSATRNHVWGGLKGETGTGFRAVRGAFGSEIDPWRAGPPHGGDAILRSGSSGGKQGPQKSSGKKHPTVGVEVNVVGRQRIGAL